MKNPLLPLLVCAAGLCLAAAAPVPTETLSRVQVDQSGDRIIAIFDRTVTVDGETLTPPPREVVVTIADKDARTVTVGNKTYTYAEAVAVMLAIAEKERVAHVAALKAKSP